MFGAVRAGPVKRTNKNHSAMKTKQPKQSKPSILLKDLKPRKDAKGGRQTPKLDFGDRMKAGLDTFTPPPSPPAT